MRIDFFLPAARRDDETLQEGRLLVMASWCLAGTALSGLVVRALIGDLDFATVGIFSFCGAVFLGLPWLLRVTGSLRLTSYVLVVTFFGGLVTTSYFVGNLESSVILLVPAVPILTAFLLGFRTAGALAAMLVVLVWAYALARLGGVSLPPSPLPESRIWIAKATGFSFSIGLTVYFAALYEGQRRDAARRRRKSEAEREGVVVELEERNAELRRFTRAVTHDLKSPLITIKGFLGLLAKDLAEGDEERAHKDMEVLAGVADKMQILIEDLLEFSRIGRRPETWAEISLEDLAREAIELVHGRIVGRGVEVELATDLPSFHGDPMLLRMVFLNLLDNAVKFMGEQPRPRVRIGLRRAAERQVFFVEDNGMGISSRYQEKIFGLFEKLDADEGGTGIGLASIRRAVEAHDGQVWVESEGEGQGATFCFTLGEP